MLSVAAAATAWGADVTVTLVSGLGKNAVSIEEKQALWKSPFGGWAITTWPFALRVDDSYFFQYASVQQKLLKQAGDSNSESALAPAILNQVFGLPDDSVDAGAMAGFRFDRRAAETIRLAAGKHVIHPFGMEFTVADDGTLTTGDPRLRIAPQASHIEMICYPVTVKMLDRKRSVSGPIQLSYGGKALLGGLDSLFAEYDKQNMLAPGTAMGFGFRRVTVYLPASSEGNAYDVNGVKFEVSGEGKVKLAPDAKARCDDDRTICVDRPAGKPEVAAVLNPLGVSWVESTGEVKIVCGSESVIVNEGLKIPGSGAKSETGTGRQAARDTGSGSGMVRVPASGNPVVQIGGLTARLPASDTRWPHRHLIGNLADGVCWAVETMPLEAQPGAVWSCRITAAAGKAALPAALKLEVVAVADGAPGGDMELTSAAGVFTGTLPAKPGFWRLRIAAAGGSLFQGQTLGVALIGDKPIAAVSLFTVNNRALFRRGDTLDLLWVVRRKAGSTAAEWPVRLRGAGLDATVARIAIPAGGDGSTEVSGRLVMNTTALAVGEYTAVVEADGVAGYPFRFRICQRERLSDFDVYSYSIHTTGATPYPGSPVNAYIGGVNMGAPGAVPFLAAGDGALDGVFGAYANAPFGPMREMFARPNRDERYGMGAAAMGAHNAPTWPEAHSYEASNPKHTLPENLAWVRRRMALYAQTRADYPGVDGFDYGWNWQENATGWWSDSGPRLDAWQPEAAKQSEAAAWKLTQEMWPKVVAKYAHLKPISKTLSDKWPKELADIPGLTENQMRYVHSVTPSGWSLRLPNAFAEWYADLDEILPGLTHHAHVSSPGLGGGIQYWTWLGKTHRNSVDFSERSQSPFDGWRSPSVMAMDNREKQKIQLAIQSQGGRAEDIPGLFAAAGRGVDGFAFTGFSDRSDPDMIGRARVFERFGSWFVSFDPLTDVALFCSQNANAVRTALHDLARIRRPATMVGPRDVEAGELLKYKVLLLLGVGDDLPPEILDAFRIFEAKGGVILKDDACHKNVPGRSIGLAYTDKALSSCWGGAQAGGEYEHTYAWQIFLEKQATLVKAFAGTPQPPVMTPDTDVLLSPLAGKDSIICFVINKTEVPLEVTFPDERTSRFRQKNVLPKIGELQVEKGWHVHNLLTGKPAPAESTAKGLRVPLELTRAEGDIYLLTRREPARMTIRVDRTSPINARLTGGLADADGKLLADPMPFEVILKGPDGATVFRKFASIGPDHPLDLPVPVMSAGARPELILRDLVLGTTATQPLDPAAPDTVAVRQAPDLIGGEHKILAFFSTRKNKGPVTILLDQGQDAYRPVAEKIAALLKQGGREARVTTFDAADIQPLHLRWYPQPEDTQVLHSVTNGAAWAWRVNMNVWAAFEKDKFGGITKTDYAKPSAGYVEMGPRLRHDADVVLFGLPSDNRVANDLVPWLRRVPTDNYPAAGGFFVHYLWSPFRAGYDALYLGCRDVAGAEAAAACLAGLKLPNPPSPPPWPEQKPVVVQGGAPAPLENMANVLGGTPIVSLDFSPSGNRLFAATLSYAEWLFVMDPEGAILEKRMPPETQVFPDWYRWGRYATPLSDTLLRIWLWNAVYQYDLTRGWISRAPKSSLVEDPKAGRTFQGASDRLLALDPQGRILWRYEDSNHSSDLSTVRDVSPRAISGDRRVLLASAFAKGDKNAIITPSVLGFDCATGKVLWQRAGIVLNAGKVIALDDRFIVMADDKTVHELIAADGRAGTAMSSLSGSPDWVLQVPGRKVLLIAENDHFDWKGPASRVYFRSLEGGPDQALKVPGRVVAVTTAPDNKSFAVVTSVNRSLLFASDGTRLWETETPSATILRFSPDGKTVATAGRDGVVRLYNAVDGKLRRESDLNIGNSITAETYVKQERMGDVPTEAGRTPKPLPPEPSYLKSLPAKSVSFGPNLAPPERMRELLKPADPVAVDGDKPGYLGTLSGVVTLPPIKVTAGTTYLVELLNGVGIPTNTASLLRLEISVVGKQKSQNLPCTVRLPVDSTLERRRFAFRADVGDDVTLTMRAILPSVVAARNTTRRTFDKVEASSIPVVIGDVVVSAIRFPGRNMLFDGGPSSRSKPSGSFTCMLYALNDGITATEEVDVKSPTIPLQLVNGAIANSKTVWDKITGRPEGIVAYADAVVRFDKPSALSAIVVYEDMTGPVITEGGSVGERTTMRYAVDVRNKAGQWARIGVMSENRQLVNIFPCPAYDIDSVRYVWAGRHDFMNLGRTDGFVRTAQIEAYVSGEALDLEYLMEVNEAGDLPRFD
jgi:WD40 repeat protein